MNDKEEVKLLDIPEKVEENINAVWSNRYGWHLQRKEVPSVSEEE